MVMDMRLRDPMVGRLLEGRYAVESFIAHGGMATVYLATDNRLERRVAVKVMHAHLSDDPDTVARFEREARSAARLSSPEIVSIFDQGSDAGRAYLVMEYVPGINLRVLLRDRGRLTPGEALAVMDHVTSALATAHAAGLVHRDVKPENVLVTADGRVKLADFGLARAVAGSTVTTTGSVLLGTATYLAPEQFLHGTADARSDVYAAGILFYELLTGVPPYAADNPNALLQRHVSEDIAPPSRAVKGIAPQIDALTTWAASRDPQERPADAGELHASLIDVRDRLGLHDRVPALPSTATTSLPLATGLTGGGRRGGRDTTQVVAGGPPPGAPTQAVKRRRRRGPILAAVLTIVVALAAVAGWWLAEGRYTHVPGGLIGDTRAQADQALSSAGLHAHWLASAHSTDVVAGEVISATPSGRIHKGGTVDLTLSLGKVTHQLPSVHGKSQSAATATLSALHISVSTVEHHYSNTVASGLVVSTDPASGTTLPEGSSVKLIVSRGQHFVTLPAMVGKPATTVESELQQLGLGFKEHQAYSNDVDSGNVISTNPSGAKAVIGSTIRLTVSKGQQLFLVPDETGQPIDAAVKAINQAGFIAHPVQVFPGGPGQVLHEKLRNQEEPRGTEVTLDYY
jgi:serine/threonine-protein kinase